MPKKKSNFHSDYSIVFWILASLAIAWGILGFYGKPRDSHSAFPISEGDSLGIYLPQRPMTFEGVLAATQEGATFTPFDNSSRAITGNDQVHVWIRIPLENTSEYSQTGIIELKHHWTSLARIFIPSNEATYAIYQNSPSNDPNIQQTPYKIPAFQIQLSAGESKVIYLKLQDAHWVSPKISYWDAPIEFQNTIQSNERFVHIYIGLLIGLFIANLAAYLAFRFKDIGYYLLYLLAAFVINLLNFNAYNSGTLKLAGIHQTALTPDANFFLFHGLLILTACLHLLFVHEFLGRGHLSPRINRTLNWILVSLFALAPMVMFGPGVLLGDHIRLPAISIWLGVTLSVLALGIHAMLKGISQARYLVVANCLLAIFSIRYWFVTLSGQTMEARLLHFWLYAACVEMVILSYALIERFMQTHQEKKQAQAKLLEEARSHAELQSQFNSKLTETVHSRTHELEESNQQKERLIEFLAHDIRTPLNALVSVSSLLARSPGEFSQERLEAFAQQIEGNARGVSELMENLLSWATLRNKRMQFHKQDYLVDDLILEALAMIRTQAQLKSIQLHTQLPRACYVYCDFNAIVSVLRNLLSNAVKFVPEGGSIHLEVAQQNMEVQFSLQDSGTGMQPEQVASIRRQQPITSTRGLDGEYGVGLGFGICFELLSEHQSQLKVDSAPQQGSRFYFSLTSSDLDS
ncbi:sensor histidine kinase [Coraliomargarita sp. SDUM461003]|uniref:histidine kinase n=1 Tax=Thalassobacterium maritimum TaxID=3041265 RepID=A0ABU1ASM3_9BACT|nr:sensor histidine kinase [Coraliomargarita sp. SDUM461003]MDQ8207096.1 sensor histidine kinase [Coraliomargarita sp. SDUM461003]